MGIQCSGSGVELGVQFSKNFLEFGPCLPHSVGDEQEVLITNPTDFPIEIYSVEFDNQYIDEEKTLRMMKGWDRDNCILLPPREAGQGLPKELTDFYAEHIRKVKLAEKKQAEKTAAALMELTADGKCFVQYCPGVFLSSMYVIESLQFTIMPILLVLI